MEEEASVDRSIDRSRRRVEEENSFDSRRIQDATMIGNDLRRSIARSLDLSRDHAPVAEAASGPARAVPALEIAADARLARRPAVVPLDPAP